MSRFTKTAIMEAFTELLNESPLDKIRVKDIVNRCGINRNTFYYYYHDIYELLADVFKTEAEKILSADYVTAEWQDGILSATSFALKNKRAVFHIYNSMNRELLERYLGEVTGFIMDHAVRELAEGMEVSEKDMSIISLFYRVAVSGCVMEWLGMGMREDPEPFIRRLGFLLEGNIKHALEKASKNRT